MLNMKTLLLGGTVLSALMMADTASAQQAAPAGQFESLFSRDRNTSVLQRERPEYDPQGIRAGGFIIRPKLDLGIGYSDNVFAIDSNTNAAFSDREDFFFVLRPELTAESNWNRHSLVTGAYVEAYQHVDFDSENVVDAGVFLDGRIDVNRNAALILGGAYDLLNESRKIANGANLSREPIEYERGNVYGGIEQEFGRIRYRGRLDYTTYDYDDGRSVLLGNPVIDQDFRDRDEIEVLAQIGFAVTRDASVFVRGTFRERDYDQIALGTLNRNSEGYTVSGGVDFDITRLARGTVAIGYLEEEFDDPALGTIDGLSADIGIEYFPTQLTTLGLRATREVKASGIANAAGFASTDIILSADQELARNIILSGQVGYGLDDYENIDREDERYYASIGAKWLINQLLSAKLEYTYIDQDSDADPAVDPFAKQFTANEIMLTLTAER